eukprot:6192878-Prymnesium_polylepis.3
MRCAAATQASCTPGTPVAALTMWLSPPGSTPVPTSSPNRACELSARSRTRARAPERCATRTLNAAPTLPTASCTPMLAAYSSKEMPASPATAACRLLATANAAAPIPAPPTNGHCTEQATAPAARRERACASSHPLAVE